jgi:hypothetical protein
LSLNIIIFQQKKNNNWNAHAVSLKYSIFLQLKASSRRSNLLKINTISNTSNVKKYLQQPDGVSFQRNGNLKAFLYRGKLQKTITEKNGKIYILRLNMTALGIPEGPALSGVFLF